MNGYQLVDAVLAKTGNDVGPLIELAGGHETDWLEFKAATRPEGGVLKAGESWDDYTWGVAEALFALANGIGGAVLLGVVDKAERGEGAMPIGLESSGYSNDDDEFLRNLFDQVLNRPTGWSVTKVGRLRCAEWHGLFRPTLGRFLGQPVAIILVRPRSPEDTWLSLTGKALKRAEPDRYCVPVRLPGNVGRNKQFDTPQDASQYWRTRKIERPDLDEEFVRFSKKWAELTQQPGQEPSSDPGVVATAIRTYVDGLKRSLGSMESVFTPLSATERLTGREYEPEATESVGAGGFRRHNRGSGQTGAAAIANGSSMLLASSRRSGIQRLLSEESRAIVLGGSGAGKSTCLARIALSTAANWNPGGRWPLLVSLNEYARSGLRALLLKPLPGLVWADLQPDIESGRLTLLLDGLNECPVELFDQCCSDIDDLLRRFPAARLVISSQSTHHPRPLGLPAFELLPMDREQQQRFLTLRLGSPDRATELLDRLYRQPGADFIASSPLLLCMVAEAGNDENALPAGRADLYRRFLDRWHDRESKHARNGGTMFRWTLPEMRSALARLAFRMRARGWTSCDRGFAIQSLIEVLAGDAHEFIDRTTQGLLLVADESHQRLRFSHETLHDYLAAEHIVADPGSLTLRMLGDRANARSRTWAMPLALALELLPDPPEALLRNAWPAEPLLVAAALRDSGHLSSLPIEGDPWMRGVVLAMRGDNPTTEARDIAYTAHYPPKYPYPVTLINSLAGSAFWYAGLTHPEGKPRIEKIERLLLEGGYPWFELLPAACAGQPALMARLSPVQRLLIESADGPDRANALDSATVPELCGLLRLKRIRPEDLHRRWSSALRRADPVALEQDLLCLLGAEKWLQGDFSPVRELTRAYREQLRLIGRNRKLTFRLLNVLVDHKVLTAGEVRGEAGRLSDIIKRTSAMNLFRFLANGVIKRQDLPEEDAARLLWQLPPDLLRKLQVANLIRSADAASALERSDTFHRIRAPHHRT